jgi:hypothetical protein
MSRSLFLVAVALGLYAFVTTLTEPPRPIVTSDPVTRAVINGLGVVLTIWFWSPWIQWAGRQVREFVQTVRA